MRIKTATIWHYLKTFLIPATIAGVFVSLASRIAFLRPYPLPYDESYHMGIIKIYAQHPNPLLASQPQGGDPYGALARDGSYLYHYLMSFPYRLVSHFVSTEQTQVMILRGTSIALGLVTLYLVYRLARKLGLSVFGSQLAAGLLAITPVFYDVSAEVNYDNLFIPLALLTTLIGLHLADRLRKRELPLAQLAGLVSLIFLSCLVKFPYLPIGLAIGIYLIIVAVRSFGIKGLLHEIVRAWSKLAVIMKLSIIGIVAISGLLWFQRYGINAIRYHDPVPNCSVVLSEAHCSQYGIWFRDNHLRTTTGERGVVNPVVYSAHWLYMMYRGVVSLLRIDTGSLQTFQQGSFKALIKVAVVVSAVCMVIASKQLSRHSKQFILLGLIALLYGFSLWEQNIVTYYSLHEYIAVQGRYLLPILPFLYAGIFLTYEYAFNRLTNFGLSRAYAALSGFIIVCWLAIQKLRRIGALTLQGFFVRPIAPEQIDNLPIGKFTP